MGSLHDLERQHSIKWKKFALGVVSDTELLAAPQSRDMDGDLAVDPDTEYVVTRTEWSTNVPGTFVLRDGSANIEGVRKFSANSGDKNPVRIPVGKGKALTVTTTGAGIALELRIGYYVKKHSHSRGVTA